MPAKNKLEAAPKSKKKLRNTVLNKVMKGKVGAKGGKTGFLAKAANVVTGAGDTILKSKVAFMKQNGGKNVRISYLNHPPTPYSTIFNAKSVPNMSIDEIE